MNTAPYFGIVDMGVDTNLTFEGDCMSTITKLPGTCEVSAGKSSVRFSDIQADRSSSRYFLKPAHFCRDITRYRCSVWPERRSDQRCDWSRQ